MPTVVALPEVMTIDEMLALPENGTDRELIRGVLKERPMTMRNRTHSRIEVRTSQVLANWLDTRSEPRGEVVCGEAGFILKRAPDSGVGTDVAYVSPEVIARTPEKSPYYEGPPVLAVEILSPSDQQADIDEKIALYLECGVLLVWIISPGQRTVTVHRPNAKPEFFTEDQELTAEPHLPGFRVAVAKLFGG